MEEFILQSVQGLLISSAQLKLILATAAEMDKQAHHFYNVLLSIYTQTTCCFFLLLYAVSEGVKKKLWVGGGQKS